MRVELYTCQVCGKKFKVPFVMKVDNASPEMIRMIEHEEEHKFTDGRAGWDLKIVEEKDA